MPERLSADSASFVPVARLTRRALMGAGAGLIVAACSRPAPWKPRPVEAREGIVELDTSEYPELVTAGGMVALKPKGMRKPVLVMRVENDRFRVMSLECPHLRCTVRWDNDEQRLRCPCHGSRFDDAGRVLEGPAKRGLRILESQSRGTQLSFRLPRD